MNEDRRPNVAGVPAPRPENGAESWDQEALRRDAHLLEHREGADGHERPAPEPPREGAD